MNNYTVTAFRWDDGHPGLFMRAELTFASGLMQPVYVDTRGGMPGSLRLPGGGHTTGHQVRGQWFRLHTMRTWETAPAALNEWLHRDENAKALIELLLADVENQRANLPAGITATGSVRGTIRDTTSPR